MPHLFTDEEMGIGPAASAAPRKRRFTDEEMGLSAAPTAQAAPSSHNAGLTAPPIDPTVHPDLLKPRPTDLPPSSFGRAVKIGSQGSGAGAAELLGLPVDLSLAALNLGSAGAETVTNWMLPDESEISLPRFGGPTEIGGYEFAGPIGSSAFIKGLASDATSAVGIEPIPVENMNEYEKLGYNVNRLGTESLATGGALARTALKAAPGTITHSMSRPYRDALDNAATMPGPVRAEIEAAKPLLTDAASGAGAGAMLTESQKHFPDSPIADMAATMLGGMGGASAATLGRAPATAARNIYERWMPAKGATPDPVTGLLPTVRTTNQAARFVQSRTSDPDAAAVRIRQRTQEARERGEPVPTSGVASDDIGLIMGERGERLRNSKPFQERDQELRHTAEAQVTSLRDPDADPLAPVRRVDQDVAAQRERAQLPVQQARGELEQAQAASAQRITEAEARREAQMAIRQEEITRQQSGVSAAEEAERNLGGMIAARRTGATSASERVDEAVGTAKQADEARKAGIYREAESLGRSTRIDPTGLADDARAIRDGISDLAGQDPALNNIMRDLDRLSPVPTKDVPEPEIAEITVTDLIAMRPRLSRAREAASQHMRGDVVERLDEINASIKGSLDHLAEQGDAAALKWQEAEANFRDDFAPKYREGVGRQLDRAERSGSGTAASAVAGKFLHPLGGGKEAAEDLNRILRNASSEAEGQAAARDYVLADMAKVVGADGSINAARLRTWIADRTGMFQAMPNLKAEAEKVLRDVVNRRNATTDLQRELESAIGARRNTDATMRKEIAAIKADSRLTEKQKASRVAEMERQAADVEADIQKSATALLLGADPIEAAKRVFSRGQFKGEEAMREIVGKLKGDKQALAGWKRAVTEHLIDRVTTTNTSMAVGADGPISIAGLKKFFDANDRALVAVYSPPEMHALRRAHKILEPLGNLQRQGTSGSYTVENKMLWNSVEAGLLAVTGNAITTGMVMKRIRTFLRFLPNPEAQVQHLIERLYFDPELAQHLLTRNVKDIGKTEWNGKLMRLLAVGEGAREINDEDDE